MTDVIRLWQSEERPLVLENSTPIHERTTVYEVGHQSSFQFPSVPGIYRGFQKAAPSDSSGASFLAPTTLAWSLTRANLAKKE